MRQVWQKTHFAAICKAHEQQGSKGRSTVNKLKYEDTERLDISYNPDGNNIIIKSVLIPKTTKSTL